MDRFVPFGIITSIQHEYQIDKAQVGFLQTLFLISYMFVNPFAGYIGDRYDRKIISIIALLSWATVVFASSSVHFSQVTQSSLGSN